MRNSTTRSYVCTATTCLIYTSAHVIAPTCINGEGTYRACLYFSIVLTMTRVIGYSLYFVGRYTALFNALNALVHQLNSATGSYTILYIGNGELLYQLVIQIV